MMNFHLHKMLFGILFICIPFGTLLSQNNDTIDIKNGNNYPKTPYELLEFEIWTMTSMQGNENVKWESFKVLKELSVVNSSWKFISNKLEVNIPPLNTINYSFVFDQTKGLGAITITDNKSKESVEFEILQISGKDLQLIHRKTDLFFFFTNNNQF